MTKGEYKKPRIIITYLKKMQTSMKK